MNVLKIKNVCKILASTALWAILVAVCLCSLSLDASAATKSDLTFTLNEDGESYSVTDCNTNATGTLTIPATYNGKPVTAIGSSAFEYCSSLTGITVSNGITSIGYSAFYNCSSLTSIQIPNSIISIARSAFANCHNLTYHTYDNAQYLGNQKNPYVVLICTTSNDITACNIHAQTRVVYDYAFSSCNKLSEIIIPEGVTHIGQLALGHGSTLKTIVIPDSITSIDSAAFYGTANLDYSVYDNARYLGNENNPYVVLMESTSDDIASCDIPSDTKIIFHKAFKDCSSLTGINIPDSVVSIGYSAFEGCVGLKSATIGNRVTEIGTNAFYHCESLTSVAIPDSVTSIGDSIFEGCASLKSAVIGNGVTRIGYYAFGSCGSLTSVTIGNGVTCIDAWAFDYCGSLTQISIPKGVTDISCDFSHCYSLTAINVNKNNPNYCSVSGVLFNKAKTQLLRVPGGFSGAYTVPDGVTDVGYAFVTCIKLTSVTISKDVAVLIGSSFDGCSSLKKIIVNKNNPNFSSVSGVLFDKAKTKLIRVPCGKSGAYTVPDGVTAFGDYAFEDCALLTEVTIPEGVRLLYYRLFSGCTHLKKITIPDSVNDIKYDAFTGCDSLQYNKYQNACYLGNAKNPYHALIKGVSKDIKKCTIYPKTKLIAEEALK